MRGVPEPKLGLVSRAHGGVLFIDEIGELEPMFAAALLKVLEDKRVTFESSYYDENAPNVPEYVKRPFREGAPADSSSSERRRASPTTIDPAVRSRCARSISNRSRSRSRQDRAGCDQAPGCDRRPRHSQADRVLYDRRRKACKSSRRVRAALSRRHEASQARAARRKTTARLGGRGAKAAHASQAVTISETTCARSSRPAASQTFSGARASRA